MSSAVQFDGKGQDNVIRTVGESLVVRGSAFMYSLGSGIFGTRLCIHI